MTKDPLRAPHARAVCIEQHDGWYMRARAAVLAASGLERCARIAQPSQAGQSVPALSTRALCALTCAQRRPVVHPTASDPTSRAAAPTRVGVSA
jgi:hypothetical protein